MYEPYELTSQGEKKNKEYQYPGLVKVGDLEKPVMWNKQGLEKFLKPIQQWSKKNHVSSNRIIAEEFGINVLFRELPNTCKILFLSSTKKVGINHSMHSVKTHGQG